MADFSARIRNRDWKGFTGKRIKNVIVGMGDGTRTGDGREALRTTAIATSLLQVRLQHRRHRPGGSPCGGSSAAETLFIISSKTFHHARNAPTLAPPRLVPQIAGRGET